MLPVLMGARPLRGVCLVVVPGQGNCCDLVPRPPVGVGVTASVKDGSCWAEEGRKVIDVARTSKPAHVGGDGAVVAEKMWDVFAGCCLAFRLEGCRAQACVCALVDRGHRSESLGAEVFG